MVKTEGAGSRGMAFIRNNPQLLYTLFLLIVIPLAFFVTSERFLSVARENQDRLERSRVSLLHDIVAVFSPLYIADPSFLEPKIAEIVRQNDPIIQFLVLRHVHDTEYTILAQSGSERLERFLPDEQEAFLLKQSLVATGNTTLMERFIDSNRYWDAARTILGADGEPFYLYTRVSMANVDAIAERNITNAYIVLFIIIILVFLLLLRQAKIIDYAALYRRLQEVDRMKDDFVSMAAHELRSPLGIIRGYVEFLRDEKGLTDGGKQTLEHIERSASQLNLMVADILDVAKLQEGRMSFAFSTIDPRSMLQEVGESFRQGALQKGLTFTLEIPPSLPSLSVDPERFRQILVNMLGNAVKYTPKGSVSLIAKKIYDKVEIRVSDTGLGISAEDQKHLFEKFFRVKNEETKLITGTGLGLWIAHEIVKQMRGTITVESIQGKGTDFILRFPIQKA